MRTCAGRERVRKRGGRERERPKELWKGDGGRNKNRNKKKFVAETKISFSEQGG